MAHTPLAIDCLGPQFDELVSALTATITPVGSNGSSTQESAQKLAQARDQLLESCNTLLGQLAQLRQAVESTPQLQQGTRQSGAGPSASQPQPPAAAAAATAAGGEPDSMEVEPQQQGQDQVQNQVAAALPQQHLQFLQKLQGLTS